MATSVLAFTSTVAKISNATTAQYPIEEFVSKKDEISKSQLSIP